MLAPPYPPAARRSSRAAEAVSDLAQRMFVLTLAHARRMTSSVILRLAYGYEVKSDDDRFVDLSEAALDTFFKSTAPGWVVDAFPIRAYSIHPRRYLPSGTTDSLRSSLYSCVDAGRGVQATSCSVAQDRRGLTLYDHELDESANGARLSCRSLRPGLIFRRRKRAPPCLLLQQTFSPNPTISTCSQP